jgi:dipeptidyl aminopeptidase/acylaminoacyl peptidase
MPAGGFPAIVFNHGYIPPAQYSTTERYVAYVDYLASNGFVVFKIDYRGNGQSEGRASGTYFAPDYTIDAISAVKSLQVFDKVNPKRIGMWGHSMAGNLTLRAMEVSPDIKAGVIWAGAVYSYADMAKYGIHDSSYVRRTFEQNAPTPTADRNGLSSQLQKIRTNPGSIDFAAPLWQSVSLTANLKYLKAPLQIDHATDDPVVNIGYSRDLAKALQTAGKKYEFHEYKGGGHNIESPYFEQAMENTVSFFKANL